MSSGQLRASQLVTTFGPGAMVDLPDTSAIIAGLEFWSYDRNTIPNIEIHEPRLLEKLKKIVKAPNLTLLLPPPASEAPHGFHPDVVAWRFPEWFIVQHTEFTPAPFNFRRRRLVHLNSIDGNYYRDDDKKRHSVVPVRFVRACPKGHVGDIDWKAFVHGTGVNCTRNLWMEERGTTGDLAEVWITCDCGEERAMSQAARLELHALGNCNGSRPWLGQGSKESCGLPNRLLIRSASNAYFPQLMSVISIPDKHSPIDDVVRVLWDDFLSDVESMDDLARYRKKPTVALRLEGIADEDVYAAIGRVRSGSAGQDRPIKEVEFEALTEAKDEMGMDVPEGIFFARSLPKAAWNAPWMGVIQRVVLVHRLREVVAQVGFTRFEAAGPDIQGELSLNVEPAPLALGISWLPAIENRGEGVFIQINPDAVSTWLDKPAVKARGEKLAAGFAAWKAEHVGSNREFPGLPYYLLHSLSHLLMTAISLECGYPASSLRERIYSMPGHYGILIYTGSTDSEGTLGGLIMAARDIRRHMRRALDMGLLCSNDPVCAYHEPSRHDLQPLLGSACHGCMLVSETSCEQRNEFLDRALLVATVEALGAEFFT
ncbi:DUF1998 domain-containing protein [Oryzomonas rubra]|uniref:DUF1998 domain-containing protein n=1 Tax=Oryzomonas rubra TaxID=2509454 RepID=A0A5A9XTQ4_9BACT|nr:DUF1998 domain-containing protein [Oryzomonas rubra]KAA0895459.1 DUF1998 domain-containing protein [Oryzomonas rubra]